MATLRYGFALFLIPVAFGLRQHTVSVNSWRHRVDSRIGSCIEPDEPGILQGNEDKWQELVWNKMDSNSSLRMDAWANKPWGISWYPNHRMIGLVQNDTKYPQQLPDQLNYSLDSVCFEFNYDIEDQPDPAGCRVFAKTFAPLKTLRNCIVGHLDSDPVWNRSTVRTRQNNFHAQEMIKLVLFKPMPGDYDAASYHVMRKINFTAANVQGKNKNPVLTEESMTAIQEQCFEVQQNKSLTQALFLQRIGVCLPLMYDKAEIQGYGITDGIDKFVSKSYYGEKMQMRKKHTFPVPPICGRLALAAIPGFQRAKYSMWTWTTIGSNDRKPPWSTCLDPDATNCRLAYFCWESSLNRVCGISPKCCPPGRSPESPMKTHQACKDNPDGNLGASDHIRWQPADWFFGLKRRCPRMMQTGL